MISTPGERSRPTQCAAPATTTPAATAHHRAFGLIAAAATLLTACNVLPPAESYLNVITPYRMDIVQGNAVTAEQAALVKPGMSRLQVRDILGTPMLTDIFHADRWDYVFTMVRPGQAPQKRTIVATFKGDVLDKLDAPGLPSEREFIAAIAPAKTTPKPPVLELTDEQRKALPAPAKATPAAAAASGPTRRYPPLEPV